MMDNSTIVFLLLFKKAGEAMVGAVKQLFETAEERAAREAEERLVANLAGLGVLIVGGAFVWYFWPQLNAAVLWVFSN